MLPEQLYEGHVLAILLQIAACMQSTCKLRSAPVVLVGLADARSRRPRCCRLPRPQGAWTLPFEIVRPHPERPSLIKPRPTFLSRGEDGWHENATLQPCPVAGLSLVHKLVCANAFRHHEITQTQSPGRTQKILLFNLLYVQNNAQQVQVVPCARVQKAGTIRGADHCWLCSGLRDGCSWKSGC